MFYPVPVLGEQGNRQVYRFDLFLHAYDVQLLFSQNQIHIHHVPPPTSNAVWILLTIYP
jgi:hypothetical protein